MQREARDKRVDGEAAYSPVRKSASPPSGKSVSSPSPTGIKAGRQNNLFDDDEDLTPFVARESESVPSSSESEDTNTRRVAPDDPFSPPEESKSNFQTPLSSKSENLDRADTESCRSESSSPRGTDEGRRRIAAGPSEASDGGGEGRADPEPEEDSNEDVPHPTLLSPSESELGNRKRMNSHKWPEGFKTSGFLGGRPAEHLVQRRLPFVKLEESQRPQVKVLTEPGVKIDHPGDSTTSCHGVTTSASSQPASDDFALDEARAESHVSVADVSEECVEAIPESWLLDDGEQLTLMPHQRVGVAWLKRRIDDDCGAVLADDMGLGKTVQVCVLLKILIKAKKVTRVLVLCPKSVMMQWEEHILNICHKKIKIYQFHGSRKFKVLEEFHDEIGPRRRLLLTTYETFRTNDTSLVQPSRDNFGWDLWIADEATAMKNPGSSNWRSASGIRSRWRLLLTGTPIMNNYIELWALMDLAQPGLLEDLSQFKRKYSVLIDRKGRAGDLRRQQLVKTLRTTILPFLLRRTKKDVFATPPPSAALPGQEGESAPGSEVNFPTQSLPTKTDLIIFQEMSELQIQIYEGVRSRLDLRNLGNVLTNINRLLSLCRHPVLLLPPERQIWRTELRDRRAALAEASLRLDDDESVTEHDPVSGPGVNETELMLIERSIDQTSAEQMRLVCPKFEALKRLLPTLIGQGHKVLIFSRSTQTLDLVEVCVMHDIEEVDYTRIDGRVEKTARDMALSRFKEDEHCRVMLVSTKAGGLGLNLTAADRVIILDPNWNPALDNQAVDRSHRIGQTRPVTIFRFIFGGAIEDNMLRVQLGKMDISSSVLAGTDFKSWLDRSDLNNLFSLTRAADSPLTKLLASKTENMKELHQWVDQELMGSAADILLAVAIFSMDDVVREIEEYTKIKKQSKQRAIWGTQMATG